MVFSALPTSARAWGGVILRRSIKFSRFHRDFGVLGFQHIEIALVGILAIKLPIVVRASQPRSRKTPWILTGN